MCGRSSVGRALASQAGCRGFESLRPLSRLFHVAVWWQFDLPDLGESIRLPQDADRVCGGEPPHGLLRHRGIGPPLPVDPCSRPTPSRTFGGRGGLLTSSSRSPNSSRCGRNDREAGGHFVSMDIQDCRDGFDTSFDREPSLPKKDDPAMCQLLAIDQFTEVLVGGQQDRAVLLGECKDLLVIRPS